MTPPDPKPKRTLKSIPWEEMRATFLSENRLTLVALAKRYRVAVRVVHDRAAAEKWVDLRREANRVSGEKLLEAARDRIIAKAGAQTLSYLDDLARVRRAVVDRYLLQLSGLEVEEEISKTITDAMTENPIVDSIVKKRRVPIPHERLIRKMLELEADLLKALAGISGSKMGGAGGGTATLKKTTEETLTFDLTQ